MVLFVSTNVEKASWNTLSVNKGRAELIFLLFGDPHRFEKGHRRKDRTINLDGIFPSRVGQWLHCRRKHIKSCDISMRQVWKLHDTYRCIAVHKYDNEKWFKRWRFIPLHTNIEKSIRTVSITKLALLL